MARPVAADAEATKARILAAAVRLVSLRGVDGCTVRDIAAESKVSLATVLHYYGSKDGLYAAVVEAMDKQLGGLRASLLEEVRPGQAAPEMIAAMTRVAWRFALAHRMAHRVILRAVLDHGGLPDDRVEKFLRPGLSEAEALLAPLLGIPPLQARLGVQTLIMLCARYAIAGADELCLITHAPTPAEAETLIGEHLAELAIGLFLPKKETA